MLIAENFEKGGVVEKRGEEETKSMPHAPVIIFRFASIHGLACFNRWKEHPYIVLQYTLKSIQK